MSVIELLGVVVFGLLFFLTEEFRDSWRYSVPTLAATVLISAVLSRLLYRKLPALLVWCLLGAFTAAVAAILRVAVVYGGYVSFLRDVNCFDRRGLDNVSYLLFAASGAVAGGLISRRDPRGWLSILPLTGIVLGVFYHYNLAEGYWSSQLPNGAILLAAEFFAPAVYGWTFSVIASRLATTPTRSDFRVPNTYPISWGPAMSELQKFLLALCLAVLSAEVSLANSKISDQG